MMFQHQNQSRSRSQSRPPMYNQVELRKALDSQPMPIRGSDLSSEAYFVRFTAPRCIGLWVMDSDGTKPMAVYDDAEMTDAVCSKEAFEQADACKRLPECVRDWESAECRISCNSNPNSKVNIF